MPNDLTEKVLVWLGIDHTLSPPTARVLVGGLLIGLALAARHPQYAADAHIEFGKDYRTRAAGSDIIFFAAAVASGDERTAPEMLADEMATECPIQP